MIVRMLAGFAGPAFTINPGDEHDFPNGEAQRLIAAGFAVPVTPDKTERAIKRTSAKETRKES